MIYKKNLSTGQKIIENILQLKSTQNWELDRASLFVYNTKQLGRFANAVRS